MENTHTEAHPAHEPSGAQIRDHWNTWAWFTSMTKKGIVLVTIITVVAVYFIVR
jgi:hypothetical protein